ncbi:MULTISPECIES: hypothetical protein [Paraburkholderia]|jgi:hypothetical protein|uniref:Uncharacterized protein n=1 Tax=Paraburkholderia phenazinium TaxID=60549 RepID=A0A1N6K3Q7_9BURK|nr:hypothetical protein [Paraburkholderia phenazinium]SIO51208.1 hypothetical protein SAMN05444168_5947 [Paraburkholderia phenazinium]
MSDIPVTLGTLLWSDSPRTCASALIDAVKRNAPHNVAKLPLMQWKEIAQATEDQVSAGFDTSLGSILVRSWCDLKEVREAADPTHTPPGTTRCVQLVDHSIESVHHPKLEITIEGLASFEILFELKLALDIRGAILSIRDARLREISLVECRGDATLSSYGQTLQHYELGTVRFPAQIRFAGEGVPLTSPLTSH